MPTVAKQPQSLSGRLEQRRQELEESFWSLARELADGRQPADTERVAATLQALGKSPADLQSAAGIIRERKRLWQVYLDGRAGEKKSAEVQAAISKADKELEAAEKRHEEVTNPLQAELERIRQAQTSAGEAQRQLVRSCPYPALRVEADELTRRLEKLHQQASALRTQFRDASAAAESDTQQAQHERQNRALTTGGVTDPAAVWRERAARQRKRAEEAQTALPDVEKEIATEEKQQRALHAQMLEP